MRVFLFLAVPRCISGSFTPYMHLYGPRLRNAGALLGAMQGKYWKDHQDKKHIEIDGVCWLLDHLRPFSFNMNIPAANGQPAVTLAIELEYSSHCISRGPRKNEEIDFQSAGYERLVIDHREIRREFKQDRHALSFLLPSIVTTLRDRRCFFTGKENFLTFEIGEILPGYAKDTKYEIFFNVRRGDARNSLRLFIESAYVRDEEADNEPVNFKKSDKITAWKLFLKKSRGESIKAPTGNGLQRNRRRQ